MKENIKYYSNGASVPSLYTWRVLSYSLIITHAKSCYGYVVGMNDNSSILVRVLSKPLAKASSVNLEPFMVTCML